MFLENIIVMKGLFMDADVTAILAAIDAISQKVDTAKDELKKDIKKDIKKLQETLDVHTAQLGEIVSVVAGKRSVVIKKAPDAINRIEKKLGMKETVFSRV